MSYIHSFAQLHDYDNSNLKSFLVLGFQVLTPSLFKLIYDEKNTFFLENFFKEIYDKSKQFIEFKYYEGTKELFNNLLLTLGLLVNKEELNKIISNMNVHSIIIDIICLINNLNVFEDKTQFAEFQREGYLDELLNCQMNGIKIFILLCYLIDFNNIESIKFIFNKIFSKLNEYKNHKENIQQKMYTPHISSISTKKLSTLHSSPFFITSTASIISFAIDCKISHSSLSSGTPSNGNISIPHR